MVEGGPGGFDPEVETSRERELIDLFLQVRSLKMCFAVAPSDGRFEVKGINNAWGITTVNSGGIKVVDHNRGFEITYTLEDFLQLQHEAINYYADPSHLTTPDDRLAPMYLADLARLLDAGQKLDKDLEVGAPIETPGEPPVPETPPEPSPIFHQVGPTDTQAPDGGEETAELQHYWPTAEERDVTLRHADSYLYDTDRNKVIDRVMDERRNRRGAVAVLSKISSFLKFGRESMKSEDSDRLKEIDRARDDAYSDKDYRKGEWEKALKSVGSGRKERGRARVEEIARYREAIKYRDEAVKLIKEKRDARDLDPAREEEIDRELDHYYAYLMKLAHEDSYKFIYDRLDDVAGKPLQDVRVYIEGQPRDEPRAGEEQDPQRKPEKTFQDEERFQEWTQERLSGEQSGKYYTHLEEDEKPKIENVPEIGDQETVRRLLSLRRSLSEFSDKDLLTKGITISEVESAKKYHYAEGGMKVEIPSSPTIKISIQRGDERYVFTLYSDGFIEDGKRVAQPKNDKSIENISVRQLIINSTDPSKSVERMNPVLATIGKNDRVLEALQTAVDQLEEKVRIEKEQLERENVEKTRERAEVGQQVVSFSKQIVSLCRMIPQDAVSTPLINQLIHSATGIRANYAEARGADSDEGFINILKGCSKEAKTIYQLLDTINDTLGNDIAFRGGAELASTIRSNTDIIRSFQIMLTPNQTN